VPPKPHATETMLSFLAYFVCKACFCNAAQNQNRYEDDRSHAICRENKRSSLEVNDVGRSDVEVVGLPTDDDFAKRKGEQDQLEMGLA
jgi:hypothetical protein